jgi:hypothetical protein
MSQLRCKRPCGIFRRGQRASDGYRPCVGSNRFSFGRGGGRQVPTPPGGSATAGVPVAGSAAGGAAGPAPGGPSPTYDDEPGHTRAFSIGDADPGPYQGADPGRSAAPGQGANLGQGTDPSQGADPGQGVGAGFGPSSGYGPPEAASPGPDGARVTTYRAGQRHPQVGGARLGWRPLLAGIYRHPERTFAQMRWHQVWVPALVVSAVYGALVVFGFADTRSEVVNATFSVALMIVLSSAVSIIIAGLMFGGVTHVLARRLGGDGAWAPTIGFAMLITWTTDAPRLLFSFFLPSGNGFVQLLGWATWLLCAGLLSSMVRQLHDLPWGKALGAAALQLIALLILIKLPTLG